jgi:hypothetical protein
MKARPCQGVTAPPTRPTEGAQQLGQQRTFTAYVHAGYWTPDNPEVHMPASIKRIRESWNVRPTARDKGLTLTLKVTAYDNGMIEVDGIPINVEPAYDQGHGWLGAADVITTTLNEFRKDVVVRRKQRQSAG